MRKKPRSSRRTAQASTRSLVELVVARRSRFTRLRSCGQRAGEPDHLVELLLVAPLAPLAVVDGTACGPRASMPVAWMWPIGIRADPDVLPRGRDDELADPLEHLGILDPRSVLVEVLEPATASATADAGRRAVHSAQPAAHRGGVPAPVVPGNKAHDDDARSPKPWRTRPAAPVAGRPGDAQTRPSCPSRPRRWSRSPARRTCRRSAAAPRAGLTRPTNSAPVASCGAPTGFDSGEPRWRR